MLVMSWLCCVAHVWHCGCRYVCGKSVVYVTSDVVRVLFGMWCMPVIDVYDVVPLLRVVCVVL